MQPMIFKIRKLKKKLSFGKNKFLFELFLFFTFFITDNLLPLRLAGEFYYSLKTFNKKT